MVESRVHKALINEIDRYFKDNISGKKDVENVVDTRKFKILANDVDSYLRGSGVIELNDLIKELLKGNPDVYKLPIIVNFIDKDKNLIQCILELDKNERSITYIDKDTNDKFYFRDNATFGKYFGPAGDWVCGNAVINSMKSDVNLWNKNILHSLIWLNIDDFAKQNKIKQLEEDIKIDTNYSFISNVKTNRFNKLRLFGMAPITGRIIEVLNVYNVSLVSKQ